MSVELNQPTMVRCIIRSSMFTRVLHSLISWQHVYNHFDFIGYFDPDLYYCSFISQYNLGQISGITKLSSLSCMYGNK